MITYLGDLTVGAIVPGLVGTNAALLAELRGKLTGLLNVQATLTIKPPALAASAAAAAKVAAALAVAIDGPTVSLQLTALAALVASIQAQIAAILTLPLATAGIHAYVYTGPTNAFGGEIQNALVAGLPGGAPLDQTQALVLATRETVSWAALGTVVKVK